MLSGLNWAAIDQICYGLTLADNKPRIITASPAAPLSVWAYPSVDSASVQRFRLAKYPNKGKSLRTGVAVVYAHKEPVFLQVDSVDPELHGSRLLLFRIDGFNTEVKVKYADRVSSLVLLFRGQLTLEIDSAGKPRVIENLSGGFAYAQ